jgi:predicted phosphodiesterase
MQEKRKLKIMMASDTHGSHSQVKWDWQGDIFIHAGDFTVYSD